MIKRILHLLLMSLMSTAALASTAINVVQATVHPVKIAEEVQTFGTLVAVNKVIISPEVAGKIASIFFNDGQEVKEGALLLQIDNTQAKANLISAQADLALSKRDFQRYEELNKYGGTTKQKLDQLRAEVNAKDATVQANLNLLLKYTLTAPFTGRLGSFTVNAGDYVTPGEALVTLVNNTPLKVEYALPEDTLPKLHLGQTAVLQISAIPNKTFNAKVTYIAPSVDPQTGTISVQAELDNRDGALSPGMFAYIRQIFKEIDTLVIPEESVLASPEGSYVFVIKNNIAEKREIHVAGFMQGIAEITSGLKNGEIIVAEGQQKLSGGESVSIIDDWSTHHSHEPTLQVIKKMHETSTIAPENS